MTLLDIFLLISNLLPIKMMVDLGILKYIILCGAVSNAKRA